MEYTYLTAAWEALCLGRDCDARSTLAGRSTVFEEIVDSREVSKVKRSGAS